MQFLFWCVLVDVLLFLTHLWHFFKNIGAKIPKHVCNCGIAHGLQSFIRNTLCLIDQYYNLWKIDLLQTFPNHHVNLVMHNLTFPVVYFILQNHLQIVLKNRHIATFRQKGNNIQTFMCDTCKRGKQKQKVHKIK